MAWAGECQLGCMGTGGAGADGNCQAPACSLASPVSVSSMPTRITAHVHGTVWKVAKQPGDRVATGEAVVILEAMKMELPVESPVTGQVREIRCVEGDAVEEGALLAVVE